MCIGKSPYLRYTNTSSEEENYYRQEISNPNKIIGLDFQIAEALGIRLVTPTIPFAGI